MQPEIQKDEYQKYYVPAQSPWPIVGAIALFLIAVGAGNYVVEATKRGNWLRRPYPSCGCRSVISDAYRLV